MFIKGLTTFRLVCLKIITKLPGEEKFDLVDQFRRSSKAIPRLIAEGFEKRHQKRGLQKYLDDAIAEKNETVVSLCHARDIYKNFVILNLFILLLTNMKS